MGRFAGRGRGRGAIKEEGCLTETVIKTPVESLNERWKILFKFTTWLFPSSES